MENDDEFTDGPFGRGRHENGTGPWKQEDTERELIVYISAHNANKLSPLDLMGLSWKLPKNRDDFVVVGSFDVNGLWPNGEVVGCALARAKEIGGHDARRGSVVWFSDGFIRLVGGTCTKNHFQDAHDDFERSKTELRKMKSRLTLEAVLRETIFHMDGMRAEILSLQRDPFVRRFDLIVDQFKQHMNDVWNCMLMTSSQDGVLQIEYNKSDNAFHQAGGGGGSFGRVQYQNFGLLQGQGIFKNIHTSPAEELNKALKHIDNALTFKDAIVEDLPTEDIKKANKAMSDAVKEVNQARQLLDSMRELMTTQNLLGLVKFLNTLDGGQESFRLLDNGIQDVRAGHPIAITLDDKFITPRAPKIREQELRRAKVEG